MTEIKYIQKTYKESNSGSFLDEVMNSDEYVWPILLKAFKEVYDKQYEETN